MTLASLKSKTLILVNQPGWQDRRDFEEIRCKIEALAPDIDVQIAQADQSADLLDHTIWQRPCLVVSFGRMKTFRPKRGFVYCGRYIPKFEQLAELNRAGILIPLSAPFVFGQTLEERVWGPLVVLKPTTRGFMSQGAVFLMRTRRAHELAERIFPSGHPVREQPLLVQRFVDTGAWPSYYRVLSLFGEALYCRQTYTNKPRPPLDASDEDLLKARIATNAESTTRRQQRAANDSDVLELARRVYTAVPSIPLQGIDIIREASTGRLFVLEINPGGNTWHFSSTHMERRREQRRRILPPEEHNAFLTREDRIKQFGAWDIAAKVLIEKTYQDAR
jgi:hypothetical protein